MRIYKDIEIYTDGGQQSVEVSFVIYADDIVAAIEENPKDGEQAVLRSFADFIRFYQSVPDEIYTGFNEHQRKVIGEHLETVLTKIKGNSVV